MTTPVPVSKVSRRKVLRSAGIALGLPFLESLTPKGLRRASAAADPVRYVNIYMAHGFRKWTIGNVNLNAPGETRAHALSDALVNLQPHRENITFVRNVDNRNDQAGEPHGGAFINYMTGRQGIGGPSMDQVAAAEIGSQTPDMPSLQIGMNTSLWTQVPAGAAIFSHMSWRTDGNPIEPISDPKELFLRLVSAAGQGKPQGPVLSKNKSILDFVLADANGVTAKLNPSDRTKVNEYLDNVRTVEKKIAGMIVKGPVDTSNSCKSAMATPAAPKSLDEYLTVMTDLLVLAFQCDKTRIATFHFGREFDEPHFMPTLDFAFYTPFGVPVPGVGHHGQSHYDPKDWGPYGGPEAYERMYLGIESFYARHYARLLTGLSRIQEGSGSALDNSIVVASSGFRGTGPNNDGPAELMFEPMARAHYSVGNLHIAVAGRGGGTLTPGRHVVAQKGSSVANFHLTMLKKLGVKAAKFGLSTGTIANI